MATLINNDRYSLIVGNDVDSSYSSESAANRAAAKERKKGRRAVVVPPGEAFDGSGWSDVNGVERA